MRQREYCCDVLVYSGRPDSNRERSNKVPRPSRAFRVKFEVLQHTFSALKVDQLKLTGEMYKPYKGVRGRSMGDVEWRW